MNRSRLHNFGNSMNFLVGADAISLYRTTGELARATSVGA